MRPGEGRVRVVARCQKGGRVRPPKVRSGLGGAALATSYRGQPSIDHVADSDGHVPSEQNIHWISVSY